MSTLPANLRDVRSALRSDGVRLQIVERPADLPFAVPELRRQADVDDLTARGLCIDCGSAPAPLRAVAVRGEAAPRHHRCLSCHRAWQWRRFLWRVFSLPARPLFAGALCGRPACVLCGSAAPPGSFRGAVSQVGTEWRHAGAGVDHRFAVVCSACLDRLAAEFDPDGRRGAAPPPRLGSLGLIDLTVGDPAKPWASPVPDRELPTVNIVYDRGVPGFQRIGRALTFAVSRTADCEFIAEAVYGSGGPGTLAVLASFPLAAPGYARARLLSAFAAAAVTLCDARRVEAFLEPAAFEVVRDTLYSVAGVAGRRRLSAPPLADCNRFLGSLKRTL